MGRGNSREGFHLLLLSTEGVRSRYMGRGNSREGFHLLLLSTEGVRSRDMGRGNSREGWVGGIGPHAVLSADRRRRRLLACASARGGSSAGAGAEAGRARAQIYHLERHRAAASPAGESAAAAGAEVGAGAGPLGAGDAGAGLPGPPRDRADLTGPPRDRVAGAGADPGLEGAAPAPLESLLALVAEAPEAVGAISPVAACLEGLSARVVDAMLDAIEALHPGPPRDWALAAHVRALIRALLSSAGARRAAAERWLRVSPPPPSPFPVLTGQVSSLPSY